MRKYFPLTSSDDSYLTYTSQKKIIQYDASYFPVVLTSTIGNGRGYIEKDTTGPIDSWEVVSIGKVNKKM